MAENKTQATEADTEAYLDGLEPERRRDDARAVAALMRRVTGEPPLMWGPSIIGFGRYRYKYASGREGESFRVGFAPRKGELVFYGLLGDPEALAALGPHRTGKGCLYVKRLGDVDAGALERIVADAWARPAPEDGR